MFTGTKPKIRTRTVQVPVMKQTNGTPQSNAPNGNAPRKPIGPPPNRYKLTPSTKNRTSSSSSATQQRRNERTSQPTSRAVQRKRKLTPSTPQFASSDESSEEEDSDRLGAGLRKRQKGSSSIEPPVMNRCLEPDLKRRIRLQEADSTEKKLQDETSTDKKRLEPQEKLIHGRAMCRGEWAKDFKPAFPGSDKNPVVELQYPSPSPPERFEIAIPHDSSNFNPLDDIYFSIDEVLTHYLPPEFSADFLSETTGTVRLLKRAVAKNSADDFKTAIESFNKMIKEKLTDGTISKVLDDTHAIPLSLTKRILAQVYQRTVSPHAHLLRRVKDKQTTYGELLPPFVHTIFHQTRLSSSHVFIDLGSGVGNVVLQSALQTGAESWGIELMDTPAEFALDQASELRARAKLWNLSLGDMTLLHGSFFESEEVDEVLRRADVVLVNNKVFTQDTNTDLLNKFLDLKVGCKVVSLVSFGGGAKHSHGVRNEQSIANLFDEERYESGTQSVSWAGESVEYFIATKTR